jgi:hypothetical protein
MGLVDGNNARNIVNIDFHRSDKKKGDPPKRGVYVRASEETVRLGSKGGN